MCAAFVAWKDPSWVMCVRASGGYAHSPYNVPVGISALVKRRKQSVSKERHSCCRVYISARPQQTRSIRLSGRDELSFLLLAACQINESLYSRSDKSLSLRLNYTWKFFFFSPIFSTCQITMVKVFEWFDPIYVMFPPLLPLLDNIL